MKHDATAVFFLAITIIPGIPSKVWSTATTTITASKDNTIYQSNSSFSAGGAAGIFSGSAAQGSIRRGLFSFDVAANVPAGSVIASAN